MNLRVQPINNPKCWEAFLDEVSPPSFLHRWQWGETQRALGFPIERFGVYGDDGGTIVAVALFIETRARRGAFWLCPHGPVVYHERQLPEVLEALTPMIRARARERGMHFLRLSPLAKDTPQNNALFFQQGYRDAPIHQHPERAWILDITPAEDALLSQMRKSTRYSIKKAVADGVTIESTTAPDDVERFWRVYAETVDRQQFTPFSKQYLRTEFEMSSQSSNAVWMFARYRGEDISTALIVFDRSSGYYHHGASSNRWRQLTASHLMLWHAIQLAKKRGAQQFNFWGIAPENAPATHPWAGLTLFKKGFGGRSESYVHAKDYILSKRYWIAWGVETFRRKWRRL